MIPYRSPYGLIQEDLWPDEWKCMVACLMLNCTSRKQVEKILPAFFTNWPTPQSLISADQEQIKSAIAPLGFKHRRCQRLLDMSKAYAAMNWNHISELPGIGEYASRAWEIFFKNTVGDQPPSDGALVLYWNWRKKHGI